MAVRKAVSGPIEIEIPEMEVEQMLVTLRGVSEIITHNFGEEAMKKLEDSQGHKPKGPREARDPEAEFRDSLYVIDEADERYGFPAIAVKLAMVGAGRFTQEQMTRIRGMLNVLSPDGGDLLEIAGAKPRMRRDHVRLASGVASIAYRPGFKPWSTEVLIEFNANVIPRGQVLNLLRIAGFSIGVGDWRPEKDGPFGRFTIGDVKVLG